MKRFFGWIVAGVGAVGVLWGGYHIFDGRSEATLYGPVNALTGSLAGLAMLTLGLIATRD